MKRIIVPVLLFLLTAAAQGEKGVLGVWKNPTGSTIQIYRCGPNVCAKVIAISSKAPSRVDSENPEKALRTRPICGLEIGRSFHLTGPDQAQGGKLYDPESGNTYSGSMISDGDILKLRGYIGLSLFGRTETWTRAQKDVATCQA
jgi:uncharacterized protein (DUF2147 family)